MVFVEVGMTETVETYHHLDHEVLIDSEKHLKASRWCAKQFGQRWEAIGYRSGLWCLFWAGRDNPGKYRFCFAREQDMLLFILRWS
jgi:hypothetical protein